MRAVETRDRKTPWSVWVVTWVAATLGCGGSGSTPTATMTSATLTSDTEPGATATASVPSTGAASGPTSTGAMSSSSAGSGESETGCSFLLCSDYGSSCGAQAGLDGALRCSPCDAWMQNCPEGEKCTASANDGGNSWNQTKCAPIEPNPKAPGEPCIVEGWGASGLDNCELGAMCWDVDPETLEGVCVALCGGSSEAPSCPLGFSCAIRNDGVLNLCLPHCDPLLQDCPNDEACVPGEDSSACFPDMSGEMGAYGDACGLAHDCDPGLMCLGPQEVPGCMNEGCCTPLCDTREPNTCPGEGQVCIHWFDEGMAPPSLDTVGVCAIV